MTKQEERPEGDGGRRHPGLDEAWQSSEQGPGALVAFLAAGALLLVCALVVGLIWVGHQLDIPTFVTAPVVIALVVGGFLLLQRSVRD